MSRKARLQAFDAERDAMVVEVDGLRFQYGSLAEYKRLLKAKPWDQPIDAWIDSFNSDDVLYDIGSNVGQFALRAAVRGVRTVAIEPGAESFASLARNIRLNGVSSLVTPLPIALWKRTEMQPFHYRTVDPGSALHALGEPVDYRGKRFEPSAVHPVLAFALDDLVERFGLPQPTRIKLDVDGAEAAILSGATRTMAAGPLDLWVEFVEARAGDDTWQRTSQALLDSGFRSTARVEHEVPKSGYPRVFDLRFVREAPQEASVSAVKPSGSGR